MSNGLGESVRLSLSFGIMAKTLDPIFKKSLVDSLLMSRFSFGFASSWNSPKKITLGLIFFVMKDSRSARLRECFEDAGSDRWRTSLDAWVLLPSGCRF